jgi:hypothetical protein
MYSFTSDILQLASAILEKFNEGIGKPETLK